MAEIALKGRMKVKTLKAEFKEAFGATLRVYKSESCRGAFADDEATLASIRAEGKKGGELSVKGNMQVGNFEKKIAEMYGIGVQVANADDSKLVDNGVTLASIGKESVCKKTNQAAPEKSSSNLKKYTIKINTKGAPDIRCGMIDIAEGADAEEVLDCITSDDIDNWSDFEPHDGLESYISLEPIGCQCLGDEYNGLFELTVEDDEENVVFETDDFSDLTMVCPEYFLDGDYEEITEGADDELLQRMQKVMLEQYELDKKAIVEGYCVLAIHEMKWQYMEFEIEDDEFNPQKLFFLTNPKFECAAFDSYTDRYHLMYGDKILENLADEDGDEYCNTLYLAKRNKEGFEIIRELD
jgi:hypothetical protein